MPSDVLSDVLKTVRLTGAAFFDVAASQPWVAEQPPREMILPRFFPGAGHLIAYHVVTEGACFGCLIGGRPDRVQAGEVIVFTRGDPHVMSSSPGMRADPMTPQMLDAATAGRAPFMVNYGGDGPASAKPFCGFLACDAEPFNPLLDNLPPVMKVGSPADGETSWLGQFIRVAAAESASKRAGGESVLARLSELMFIEVIRRHLDGAALEQTGWLAGLRDPCVGRALALMHGAPAHRWTIDELARQAAASRSVLLERFATLVGAPPLRYLARWRMQIATGMLSRGEANIAAIAEATGYESEAAFSRAFKKLMGAPPSTWRRKRASRG